MLSHQEPHLLLNHLPVVGALWTVLLVAAAIVRPSAPLVRIALASLALTGLLTVPAFLTGEPAEKAVENLPGVVETAIGPHEEMAERTLVIGMGAALGAGAAWFWSRRRPERREPLLLALVLALVLAGALSWTAHLGGRVHRPELHGSRLVST